MAPTIVVANDEEKDKEIAKLKANLDEKEKEAKANFDDKEKMEAKLKANDSFQEPGPVVKAIIAGMDEDHKEEAKKAAMKAANDEPDEEKKAKMVKALEEIFDKGNGVNTNTANTEEEKEKTAVIAMLSAKVAEPIITKILTAQTKAGATEDQIGKTKSRLENMSLVAVEAEYKSQEIYINSALNANIIADDSAALIAATETSFEFNGVTGPLSAKTVDIDSIIQGAAQ